MTLKPVVLIVDRDADCRELYCAYLALEGFECLAVDDGELALRRIRERLPEIVLLDPTLPTVSGWDVVQRVKADPRLQSTRIVMFSADAYPDHRQRAAFLGADGFIPKPAKPSDVADVFRALLDVRGPNPYGAV